MRRVGWHHGRVDASRLRYEPMLATAGAIVGEAGAWAFEPKLDGWRVTVTVVDGALAVRTRNGHDVTASLPELRPLGEVLGGRDVVLDGELVAHDGNPQSFYRLSGRMAARRPGAVAAAMARIPASFVAFDVLHLGHDLTALAYRERRMALEGLALMGPSWCTITTFPGAGAELFAACTELGLEGLMAKRLDSRYEPGVRSKAWVKAKCGDWSQHHAPHRHGKR